MLAGILILMLSPGIAGCGASVGSEVPAPVTPPLEDPASAPPTAPTESPMGGQDFSYLEGSWAVRATDDKIDPAAAAPAVTDPSGTWELMVMGDSMTIYMGELRYEGLLTEADGGWSYRGMVTGSDAQGEPLSGYLELVATSTDARTFAGSMLQYVDPDGTAPGYTARWSVEATRQ